MNSRSLLCAIAAASTALSLPVCAQRAASSAIGGNATAPHAPRSAIATPTKGQGWTANGASACEKYLTADVQGAIVVGPPGRAKQLDAHSCQAGILYISLKVADIDVFRLELPRIAGVHLMPGVGDAAYWNEAGAVSAVKGHDRGCEISAVGAPQQMKIHNAELGQKLGAICNKLFALP